MCSEKLIYSPFSINFSIGQVLLKSTGKPPDPEESSPREYPTNKEIESTKYNTKFR